MDHSAPPPEMLDELRRRVAGDVFAPDDPGYDTWRSAWNPLVDQRPVVVAVADTVDDVVAAVRFARAHDLGVAVQSTGHGVAREADDAVLVVTSRLRGVRIDASHRTATVEAGARWDDLLPVARAHGLTGLSGSSNDIGVVGYTLGGGLGWLARRFGLASDTVLSIDLVTPDGLLVTTDADRHPEVFWALKGGGAGTLGVVVGMELELVPVTEVYAGTLTYPHSLAWAVVRRWRDWVIGQRPELTTQVVIEPTGVSVRGCWVGEPTLGRALIDQWRTWSLPIADDWEIRPTDRLDLIAHRTDEAIPVGITNDGLSVVRDEVVDVLVAAAAASPDGPARVAWAGIRHVGGAVRNRSEAAVNGRGRRDPFVIELCGGTAEDRHGVRTELAPYVTGATFLNLVDGVERRDRTASSFSADHLARLQAVKAALDPDHRFRFGLPITP
ncbi:MAG: FAD-binding oxidoreductase [Ilumatobacter sp.]|nr:FAD-binding oxidoreductase [Ilumatobacter sp.]